MSITGLSRNLGARQVLVDADLPVQWPTVAHRIREPVRAPDETGVSWTANTIVGRPAAPTDVGRRQLLAWVLDRADITGLPTLEPWRNRSSWEHTNP